MPKIIENLQQRLQEEARKQITESGYESMTIRSVAAACGIGVGTVYHYYPSRNALIASFMLEDWKQCTDVINAVSIESDYPETVAKCIHEQLCLFSEKHQAIIRSASASSGFSGSFEKYHGLLRSQLAAPLSKFCASDFEADFIAESLLTWTMAGKNFDEIYDIIRKLF